MEFTGKMKVIYCRNSDKKILNADLAVLFFDGPLLSKSKNKKFTRVLCCFARENS